jgi:glutaminyl-peptide cyclotransferase
MPETGMTTIGHGRVLGAALALLLALGTAARAAAPVFPADRAWAHLEAQCAFGPRVPETAAHRGCLDYIRVALERDGGRVVLQAFRDTVPAFGRWVDLTNVLARFGPARPGGLLLAAHWDSRPWADLDPDSTRRGSPILGANDGASGAAVLLALADMWRSDPPPIPVVLAFLDGEDLGREGHPEEYLAGSRYLADHLPGPSPEAAFVLDMVGSATLSLSVEAYARENFRGWASLVDGLAAELGLPSYRADWGPTVIDDHLPLIGAGLPAILLIDFRDPYWHTHGDTPAHCSRESLDQVGRLMTALVHGGAVR